jgi:hypothetical protein
MKFDRNWLESGSEVPAMPTRRRHPADPTRAIALVRASTDRQDLSPGAQVRAINAFAKANGITVVKVYEEVGISGGAAIEDRPMLLEAVDAVCQRRSKIRPRGGAISGQLAA